MKNIFITYLLFLMSLSHITFSQQTSQQNKDEILIDQNFETSCPYLTKDTKGNVVMCWGKQINKKEDIMCYAVFNSKTGLFSKPIEIPASKGAHLHSENMPKIIFKSSTEIVAVWGVDNSNTKRKYSKLVYYSQSFDNGKTWSGATRLVKDTAGVSQAYFDVELLPNGEVAILWLDNRTKTSKEGSTLYFAATKGKSGFQNEKPICETICQCCRTDLFTTSDGNIMATFRDIINDTIRDMVHIVSTDGGKTFSSPKRISADNWVINGCPHTGPTLAQNNNGLHFAWYTMGGGEGVFYCKSTDNGQTFSQRSSVSKKPSAKHPQIITLANKEIIIVWDETIKKGEKYNVWVGLQRRTFDGKIISTTFISSDDYVSEYPVVKSINGSQVVVVYTRKIGGKAGVCYKIIG